MTKAERRMFPSRSPIKVRAGYKTDEAWLYESRRSIEVYSRRKGQDATSCRIPLRVLTQFVKLACAALTEGRKK